MAQLTLAHLFAFQENDFIFCVATIAASWIFTDSEFRRIEYIFLGTLGKTAGEYFGEASKQLIAMISQLSETNKRVQQFLKV